MRDILEAVAESISDQAGERDYELERAIGHSDEDELFELLSDLGLA